MEFENDRQLIQDDFKKRAIILSDLNLPVPTTDIYDEPVRYYKANLEWTPIIEGFLDWLADIASWKDAQDENYPPIQQLLKYLEGIELDVTIDCNEVENCITISPTVINITNEVTNNSSEITNINNSVTNINNEITNINNEITNIEENVAGNVYPQLPDPIPEPDAYCGSAWSVANGLNDLIQDVIQDALTLTFSEFIQGILSAFSFKFTFMRALWDFIVASANPNIASEVTASIPYVAEAIYCSQLDLESAKTKINADGRIPNDSQIAYNSAIDAMTASKLNSLFYIGSLDESKDCSGWCGSIGWTRLLDFTKSIDGVVIHNGTWTGQYITSINGLTDFSIMLPPTDVRNAYYRRWWVGQANITAVVRFMRNGAIVSQSGINNNANSGFVDSQSFVNNPPIDQVRFVIQSSVTTREFRFEYVRVSGFGLEPQIGVPYP